MAASTLALAGKIAIVTGSGRENSIGAAIAFALAREGASVAIHYVSESSAPRAEKVARKVEELGGKAVTVRGDITNRETARVIVQDTLNAFHTKNIDILVNNAGGPIDADGPVLAETDPDQILGSFTLNYLGPILMIQSVVPHMPNGGRIINIGAMASQVYFPFVPAYSASKAALDHSTRYLAAELGKSKGITVNTVAPGAVLTDPVLNAPPEFFRSIQELSAGLTKAADRMGTPGDIADVVLFVASEKSRWITGHVFPVGGGTF